MNTPTIDPIRNYSGALTQKMAAETEQRILEALSGGGGGSSYHDIPKSRYGGAGQSPYATSSDYYAEYHSASNAAAFIDRDSRAIREFMAHIDKMSTDIRNLIAGFNDIDHRKNRQIEELRMQYEARITELEEQNKDLQAQIEEVWESMGETR